jgi:cobalt transporter subunit CbtB
MNAVAASSVAVTELSNRLPGLFALMLGLAIVFAAGFASPATLHNATHDTRHAFGLPCH